MLHSKTIIEPNLDQTNLNLNEKINFTLEPICQIYTGQTCSKFLQNQTVFVQPPHSQAQIEEKLAKAFLVIKHSKYDIIYNYLRVLKSTKKFCLEIKTTDY